MNYVHGPVTVSVPATSANLGPGFDALGLALDLRDTVTGEITGDTGPLEVSVTGAGAGAGGVPTDESHLVVRTVRRTLAELGCVPGAGLRLHCDNRVPHARGLGSSAAAIVSGVVLARALVEEGHRRLDDDAAFALAARLEGHPDNVAPALLGGLTVSGRRPEAPDTFWTTRLDVVPGVAAVVFVPPDGVSTERARGLLPEHVTHAAAAADAGFAALLVAALTSRPDQLWLATHDTLHQAYREPVMPASLALVASLRRDGVPAVVSGAGPTVLAFADHDATPAVAALLARRPDGWEAWHLPVDTRGAEVVAVTG